MRVLSLILGILCTQSLWALPVVGEKVVYIGEAVKRDGVYQVRRTIEVTGVNPFTRQYDLKLTHEQWGEGAPLGTIDQAGTVGENAFAYIEQVILPNLRQKCDGPLKSPDGRVQAMTAKDIVLTGLGPIQACKLEITTGSTINWWADETAPWAVKTIESNAAAGETLTITLQSLTKPERKITPPQEAPPAPQQPEQPEPPKETKP